MLHSLKIKGNSPLSPFNKYENCSVLRFIGKHDLTLKQHVAPRKKKAPKYLYSCAGVKVTMAKKKFIIVSTAFFYATVYKNSNAWYNTCHK